MTLSGTYTQIIVSLQVEGIHCWPGCPIDQVAYLKHPHRHIFHIRVKCPVDHDDRDIEIIQLKSKIAGFLDDGFYDLDYQCCNFGTMSCEQICQKLFAYLNTKLNLSPTEIEVLEDGENGAVATFEYLTYD